MAEQSHEQRPPELTFPDVPRLELDPVMEQLTARAADVLTAHERLRSLLRANAAVASELCLQVVLRRTAKAACELADAGYAGVGVIGSDGTLEDFVHTGMDAQTVERIGDLPRELSCRGEQAAATGCAGSQGPVRTFLRVPIRVGDQVFGHIYVTESRHNGFTDEDEQLVTSLASSAALAIHNARLYEECERRRLWQAASTRATRQLLAGSHGNPVGVVLRAAMEAAGGELALLGTRHGPGQIRIERAIGPLGLELTGSVMRRKGSGAKDGLGIDRPVLIQDFPAQVASAPSFAAPISSLIVVPLRNRDGTAGALTVGRATRRPPFTHNDLEKLAVFSNTAGIALELDRARVDRAKLLLAEEKDQIVAELHDHVIQELFATGMGLHRLADAIGRTEHQQGVVDNVDAIDATIRLIQTTMFQLHDEPQPESPRERLLALVEA